MARGPRSREERLKRLRKKYLPLLHLWLSAAAELSQAYYDRFLVKIPCYDDAVTGYLWTKKILNHRNPKRCMNAFRMEKHVFFRLCAELFRFGLRPSSRMVLEEKVAIFLFTLARAAANRDACERFQRSGDTISRTFHEVLDVFVGRNEGFTGFVREYVKTRDPNFINVPSKILTDDRYSLFKGAIGCIDGVHIECVIPEEDQGPYRGRKGFCSFNVMAVCDFDMFFTYTSVGWEGSAHDTRVLEHALDTPHMNFPRAPLGRYYLVDKGYPDRQGFMVPYSGDKYHKSQFKGKAPENVREGFNKVHSSLRSTIERCFGVLKKRWKILKGMPSYPVTSQIDIICASFALHNYILLHKRADSVLDKYEEEEEDERYLGPPDVGEDSNPHGMKTIRDGIAKKIWQNKRRFLSGI